MFRRLGHAIVRLRVSILIVTAGFTLIAVIVGGGVFDVLSSGGFEDPSMEAERADEFLREEFGTGQVNLVLLGTPESGDVTDPAVVEAGLDLTRRLAAEPDVSDVVSYWSAGNAPPLASRDGTQALVVARIEGDEDRVNDRVEEIASQFGGAQGAVTFEVGGFAAIYREMGDQIESDLQSGEMLTLPLVLVLLVIIFGGLVAAGLPLAVGGLSIVGTFFTLWLIASVTQVSVFSINMTTALGLGLAIDYSLFMVSRFREELAAGHAPHEAVVRTVDTAGRTVIFSALTVAISLAALLLFPLAFLRSFAYAGIPVVILSAAGAVFSLGAALALLGHRVDSLRLWRGRQRTADPGRQGAWHRIATAVMARPIPFATVVVALLLLLGAPFLRISLSLPDDRALRDDHESRRVHDALRSGFDTDETDAFTIVLAGEPEPGATAAYAAALSRLDRVGRVDAPSGIYMGGLQVATGASGTAAQAGDAGVYLRAVPTVEAYSPEAEELLGQIRSTEPPVPALVGGPTADLVDARASLFSRLPWALAFIAVTTFVLLFLMTGSVLVPVKALVLNVLSLSATFGAMVWVFQDGNLSGLLGFTPTGTIDLTMPILMFCIAFGLSMDYEVFLLSRIKEEHDRGASNTASVAAGLEKTGRIVTAAAALLAIVFLGLATSEVTLIQLFGLGVALAVVVDATLVRAVLVPAFMRLAGNANWWAPGPLRRFHDRYGIHEAPTVGDRTQEPAADDDARVPSGVR